MDYYASIFASNLSGGGGGGGGSSDLVALLDGSIVSFTNSDVTELRKHALNSCNNLQSVSLSNCTKINESSLANCGNLVSVNLPNLTTIGGTYAFSYCKKLPVIVLPSLASDTNSNTFNECNLLEKADFGANCTGIWNSVFNKCTVLDTVILRKTDAVAKLNNTSSFNYTPFASNGSGGTLYVPAALISSYQSATNWITILGYANNQIKSIESTHTDPTAPIDLTLYYADGTPIS